MTAALAVTRLQTILNLFVLRRMKDTMLDGKRLIDLPEKETSLVRLEFTEEEREIYGMVSPSTLCAGDSLSTSHLGGS